MKIVSILLSQNFLYFQIQDLDLKIEFQNKDDYGDCSECDQFVDNIVESLIDAAGNHDWGTVEDATARAYDACHGCDYCDLCDCVNRVDGVKISYDSSKFTPFFGLNLASKNWYFWGNGYADRGRINLYGSYGPTAVTNVYASGRICWGGNSDPSHLNEAVITFLGAKKNTDLIHDSGIDPITRDVIEIYNSDNGWLSDEYRNAYRAYLGFELV